MNRNGLLIVCVSLFSGIADPLPAQKPVVNGITPGAVIPGQTVKLVVSGTQLKGASTLWTSFPADVQLDSETPENGTLDHQVVFLVKVDKEISVGVHGVRVITDQGVSELRLLVLDDLPTLPQGNNTGIDTALPLMLPTAVEGHVDAKGLRYFRFKASAGEQLSFEVLARRLGSPLDPVLRLLDVQGHEIDYSDDVPGLQGDCQLTHTFSESGEYLLELRDIQFQGGGQHRYRLRVGDFPCVTAVYPLAVQRGTQPELQFVGKHPGAILPTTVIVPADYPQDWLYVGAHREGGKPAGFASALVSDQAEIREVEPNNQNEQAQRIQLGDNLNGRFEQPQDRDQFIFTATKGQNYTFRANTRNFGSPADLVLILMNDQGNVIAQTDDTGSEDAILKASFPADGDYLLRVEELSDRGGSEYVYRVEVTPTAPSFQLSASVSSINIPVGGVAVINVAVSRDGYNGPIYLTANGLPEGLIVNPSVIGAGVSQGTMTIQASNPDQAKTLFGQAVPLQILGRMEPGTEGPGVQATIAQALSAAQLNLPKPPGAVAKSIVLTARSGPEFTLRTEPATIALSKNLKTTVKVIAERSPEFDEAITLALEPQKDGLPKGVNVQVKPIPKGQNEIEFEIVLNHEPANEPFSLVFTGTHKKGNTTHLQPTPAVLVTVGNPGEITLDVVPAEIAQGQTLMATVKLQRIPAFEGEVTVQFKNLPAGITAAPATIPAGQSEVMVELKADPAAVPAAVENLQVEGTAKIGNATYTMNSPPVKLQVK